MSYKLTTYSSSQVIVKTKDNIKMKSRDLKRLTIQLQKVLLFTLIMAAISAALYRQWINLKGGAHWKTTPLSFSNHEVASILEHQEAYKHLMMQDTGFYKKQYSRTLVWNNGLGYVRKAGMCEGNYSYNSTIGNALPVNRDRWDTREPRCAELLEKIDTSQLLKVDVVIPFHNEQLSTLLRTINSLLNRTPPRLLQTIILVDDFSDKDKSCMQEELEMSLITKRNVKLVRTVKREGSTKTRLIGKS